MEGNPDRTRTGQRRREERAMTPQQQRACRVAMRCSELTRFPLSFASVALFVCFPPVFLFHFDHHNYSFLRRNRCLREAKPSFHLHLQGLA